MQDSTLKKGSRFVWFWGQNLCLSYSAQTCFYFPALSSEVMLRGREADHSPTFNAVVLVHIMWPWALS